MALPFVGQKLRYERTFTVEDVEAFAAVTGDRGRHHVERDAQGRLMVHGLLTATLPTRIGGDLNYIAREMVFEFVRPVFTGDALTTEVTVTELVDDGRQLRMAADCVVRNQHGKEVVKGRTNGVILKGAEQS
jgi:3-hydroxybutyryl-CoA dehydratase